MKYGHKIQIHFQLNQYSRKLARQKWIDDFDIKWIQFYKGIKVYKWYDGSIKPYDHSEDNEDDWIELN